MTNMNLQVQGVARSSLPVLLVTKILVLLGYPRPPAPNDSPDIRVLC